ncbi:hypothetical protein ACE38W_01010 [Chitinophaga sp. Hz27]|uniref:hypothetical protein n=1 Tax=Chitinophaga sp. Hz27 TaxID=3347169 RepID=UPI0035E2A47E
MELSIKKVNEILERLLKSDISRDDASVWAFNLMQAADNGRLVYYPPEKEAILWEAIIFIEGLDLREEPDIYLHNEMDIREFLQHVLNETK